MNLLSKDVDKSKTYPIDEAFSLLKEFSKVKFDESVDVSINLGVDPRKSDQVVRGSTLLPSGTGKIVKVAVFAENESAEEARIAGADIVGMDDLASEIKKGNIDFDVVIATPDTMRIVSQLGQILGPKGLMPNPKIGTVTSDVSRTVRNVKMGQVRYRVDKAGIIHTIIGRISFSASAIQQNLEALISDLKKLKPANSKGIYFKKITLSSTMGPGLILDKSLLSV
jgi:large subunit ribosomal protein L1